MEEAGHLKIQQVQHEDTANPKLQTPKDFDLRSRLHISLIISLVRWVQAHLQACQGQENERS